MLSILIPVRNCNVTLLARSLVSQLEAIQVPWEILVGEDGSEEPFRTENLSIASIPGIQVFHHKVPLGRSCNRNFLAGRARFEYLLFIDGDAGMDHDDFISKYLDILEPATVICGGTLYANTPPENPDEILRWNYGRRREQKPASVRSGNPWFSFSSFNFIVPASIFSQIRFNERITSYGHEDTLFGFKLMEKGVKVLHADNGLLHLGLEPATVFLQKISESVENLITLQREGVLPAIMTKNINLLKAAKMLERTGLRPFFSAWFRKSRHLLESRLTGKKPRMMLLDLYKLGLVCQYS